MSKEFGKVFQQFREKKAFTIKELSDGIVSPQFLRKYETNKSDISFSNLTQLLFKMNVTMDEFLSEADFIAMDHWLARMEDILDNYTHGNNSMGLSKFITQQSKDFEKFNDFKYYYMKTVAEIVYNRIFNEVYSPDIKSISNYLEKVEEWGRFEFFLSIYSNFPINDELLLFITNKSLKKIDINHTNFYYLNDFLVHVIMHFVKKNNLNIAKKLIEQYESIVLIQDSVRYVAFDIYVKFIEGLILILEKSTDGLEICNQIIAFYSDLLGHEGYATLLHKQLLSAQHKGALKK